MLKPNGYEVVIRFRAGHAVAKWMWLGMKNSIGYEAGYAVVKIGYEGVHAVTE